MTSSILAVCPPHQCDPQIAIAAIRSGQFGVLDVSMASPHIAAAALERLIHHSHGQDRWGIRCDAQCKSDKLPELIEPLRSDHKGSAKIPALVVAGGPVETAFRPFAAECLRYARSHAERVLAEVYSPAQAVTAQEVGFDGVILKGHEAGGRVSRKSAFLLVQHLHGKLRVPFWVQGGIGLQTAAAAFLAGATGVVLSEQLWLARESPFSNSQRKRFSSLDGSETVCLGDERGLFRFFSRTSRESLQQLDKQFVAGCPWPETLFEQLNRVGQNGQHKAVETLIPLGQEIGFAATLTQRYHTVGGILEAYLREITRCLELAPQQHALAPGGPLAQAHNTAFPILQGPMTRVSDVAGFCQQVSESGALPFLALALLRESAVRNLLSAVSEQMKEQSWGVGILGFVPPELRQEQLAVVLEHRPKFAIIAGGRPSQAKELEEAGISTYLHVPSRGLLEVFIRDGARKFVFEGRECGGHVGPLCSFSLWQSAITTLLKAEVGDPESFHIVFAGGIHDDISAALVATIAAPLVERGMKVGVLMGTAYLFTHEAVASGAITEEFQQQAINCADTALVESGVGHATRCAITPFVADFAAKKRELMLAGASPVEIREGLEMFNIGRLRIASKGVVRRSSLEVRAPAARLAQADALPEEDAKARALRQAAAELTQDPSELVSVDVEAQRKSGMYMIGEVAALRDKVMSATELHQQVSQGGIDTLRRLAERELPWMKPTPRRTSHRSRGLAVVGISALFPDSPNLRSYWQNLVNGFDAIREVPAERWNVEDYFSTNRFERDKIYSRWGAFVGDVVIDPLKYQIPPASLFSIEPIQLLALEVAGEALRDAGYERPDFPRERTSVIYAAAGSHDHGQRYAFRTLVRQYLPMVEGLTEEQRARIYESLENQLPEWTEDSFAGFLMNVVAGRISNRFDLRGSNFVVDAACASSLAALQIAAEQLRAEVCDAALVGAVDGTNNPFCYMCFAKTHALSPGGHSKSFDDSADGIALGEGIGAVVLKRLADAERDGDDIYAVIKGVGSSSDGRNRSLTAPFPAGQLVALKRAYQDADVSPATVSLVEAHSTGTTVGDQVECQALQQVLGDAGAQPQSCALGSVKSMIGHAKTAAGMASLIKTTLALKHRTLPPTIGVQTPNSVLRDADSPLYVNTESRPWLVGDSQRPRRAGVSSFGFGGTNFHIVLEEYDGAYHDGFHLDLSPRPCEVFAWRRSTREELCRVLDQILSDVRETPGCDLSELAAAILSDEQQRGNDPVRCRLALLASSISELQEKLREVVRRLSQSGEVHLTDADYGESSPAQAEQVCFLFPGQGSQSVNMLRELVIGHPRHHSLVEAADAATAGILEKRLSTYIFPPAPFDEAGRQRVREELNDTRIAQPAMALADLFCCELLARYGIMPAMVAGHSFGEYVALCAAGAIDADGLFRLAALRGRSVHRAGMDSSGAMAAVGAGLDETLAALKAIGSDALPANANAPDQTVIAGRTEVIEAAVTQLSKRGITARRLRVTAAFHTPALAEAAKELGGHLQAMEITSPKRPVFSNTIAQVYPSGPDAIRQLLTRHIVEPVRFHEQIQLMHERGARIFIESGPGRVLTNLVGRILGDRPHTGIAAAPAGASAWIHWGNMITRLFALGLPVQLEPWFQDRRLPRDGLRAYLREVKERCTRKPTDWIVNTGEARPASGVQQKRPALPPKQGVQPEIASAAVEPMAGVDRGSKVVVAGNGSRSRTDETTSSIAPPAQSLPAVADALRSSDLPRDDFIPPPRPGIGRMNTPTTPPTKLEGTGAASGRRATLLSDSNQLLSRWLRLQARQIETNERFLEVHERITLACLDGSNGSEVIQPLRHQGLADSGRPTAAPRLATPRPHHDVTARAVLSAEPGPAVQANIEPPRPHALALRPVVPAAITPVSRFATPATGTPPTPLLQTRNHEPKPQAIPPSRAETGLATTDIPPSTEQFRQDLLAAVSNRTGYPTDMLKENALLEADLGIDSIKTVEIFSSLTKYHKYLPGGDGVGEESLGEFAKLKTLHDIVAMYDRGRADIRAPADNPHAERAGTPLDTTNGTNNGRPDHAPLQRYEVNAVEAPLEESEKKNSLSTAPSL